MSMERLLPATRVVQKMSRQRPLTSQARRGNKDHGSSQTVNVTLKDLNREARRILRKSMLKDNLKKTRNECEVYVSGPWFPCEDYKLKRGSLRKNSVASGTEDVRTSSDDSSEREDLKRRHFLDSKENELESLSVNKLVNDSVIAEDAVMNCKGNIAQLRNNSVASDTEARADLERRHFLDSKKNELESVKKMANDSAIAEDAVKILKNCKGNIAPNAKLSQKELRVSFEDNYKQKTNGETECVNIKKNVQCVMQMTNGSGIGDDTVRNDKGKKENNKQKTNEETECAHTASTCLPWSSIRPRMLYVDGCEHEEAKKQDCVKLTHETKNEESLVSSASKPTVPVSERENTNDGPISKSEQRPFLEDIIKENSLNQTEMSQVGSGKNQELKSSECSHEMKIPILSVSDLTDEQRNSNLLSEEEQIVTNTTEESLETLHQETRNDDFEDTKLLEGKITPSSPSSRRSSSQLDPRSPRGTSPLFEGREKRLSSVSNANSSSTKSLKNNQATGQSYLENISNPLLRESLNKILNPQGPMEYFEATPNNTRYKTTAAMKLGGTLFEEEQEILLPNIKGTFKHSSLDVGNQRNMSSKYRKKSTVRFAENKGSPELSSTKCPGIVVHRSHPVRMLSVGSEYAVKGLVGQWLKRRSGNIVARDKPSVEKQETFREVQLLKVGLSMRLLAGIG